MRNALDVLSQGQSMLNPSERKVSDYILSHTDQVLKLSIRELAKKSKTSEATVMRMCRSLHFTGFKELKFSIASSLTQQTQENYKFQDIIENAPIYKTMKMITSNNIHSIKQTFAVMNEEDVMKAIQALNEAKKIIVIGIGASAIVAMDLQQKLLRVNKWCECPIDFHAQLVAATNVSHQDVVFAISYSGETAEMKKALQIAKEKGATTISLTQYTPNSLQKIADIALYVSSTESKMRSAATSSTIAQLTVIDIIFTGLATINFEQYVMYLEQTRDIISNYVK